MIMRYTSLDLNGASPVAVADAPQAGLFEQILHTVVHGINAVTVLVLVWGVLYGAARFVRAEKVRLSGRPCDQEMRDLRRAVGFYLLFALELLIAADVIETMLQPSLQHLAILGGVSAIRILIGYALGRELRDLDAVAVDTARREPTP